MRNKEDILIKDLLLEEMAKELLEQREFLRNDVKNNIETLQSENIERRITEEERKLRYTKKRPTNHCLFNTSRLYRIFAPCAAPPVLTSKNEKAVSKEPGIPVGVFASATRGLLATDHVILNHGQVTWTTPELAPHSPNYHTTPTGGRFSSRQI
ncbi:hypothetical protein TNCV_867341 [Trichonephila clavipes]|nr:hypothetical protein TNCV_867341 [Trichonephila clavipes]